MNMIIRRAPARELVSFNDLVDRVVGPAFWSFQPNWLPAGPIDLALDVSESEEEYTVKASLPGLKPEDIDVTYENKILSIRGEIKEEQDVEDARYHLHERRFGSFARSISLPFPVSQDEIKADYESGVLTLHLPKTEESRPKRIPVQAATKVVETPVASIDTKN